MIVDNCMAYIGSIFKIRERLFRTMRMLASKRTAFCHSITCLLYPVKLLDCAAACFPQMESSPHTVFYSNSKDNLVNMRAIK
jgi:hypothetical protein